MLESRDKRLILKIIEHCARIAEKTDGLNYEQFSEDLDLKEIICFNVFQVGELAKNYLMYLSKNTTEFHGN